MNWDTMRHRILRINQVANLAYTKSAGSRHDAQIAHVAMDLREIENQVKFAREDLVVEMRSEGYTWEMVGLVLQMTRQAAWERYSAHCSAVLGSTQELERQ